ncbi:MAG: carbon-nitrogen hydrolase family protein [Pseudobdellovibrio sp.]
MENTRKIKIALAQYPIDFFYSFDEWKNKINLWVDEAINQKSNILVFPEYGAMELTSLFSEQDRTQLNKQARLLKDFVDDFIKHFKSLAVQFKVYIIAPSIPVYHSENYTTNRVFVFSPTGQVEYQDKFFMTRFENEDWNIQPGEPIIKVFDTESCRFSLSTCFDIEFSFPAMAAAQAGAELIIAPSCTETIKGANRVHIGARARGLENQVYVVVSQTIGEAKWSPAVDVNYGYAAVYCTPDVGFPDDGIIQKGEPNHPGWIYAELRMSHLQKVRDLGAVFNFKSHMQIKSLLPIQAKVIKLT